MPTPKEIEIFDRVRPKIISVRDTVKGLSAKKPHDPLNLFKVKRINLLLNEINPVLRDDKPYEDFSIFAEDDLPSNSDALLMLDLYAEAMKAYKLKNSSCGAWEIERSWNVEEDDELTDED